MSYVKTLFNLVISAKLLYLILCSIPYFQIIFYISVAYIFLTSFHNPLTPSILTSFHNPLTPSVLFHAFTLFIFGIRARFQS